MEQEQEFGMLCMWDVSLTVMMKVRYCVLVRHFVGRSLIANMSFRYSVAGRVYFTVDVTTFLTLKTGCISGGDNMLTD